MKSAKQKKKTKIFRDTAEHEAFIPKQLQEICQYGKKVDGVNRHRSITSTCVRHLMQLDGLRGKQVALNARLCRVTKT